MKSIVMLTCFGWLFVFLSCKKEENQADKMSNAVSIEGTWELRNTAAAMNPLSTNYTPGNGNLLKFTNDKYEVYNNGQLARTGSYIIVPDTSVATSVCIVYPDGLFTNRLDFQDSVLAFKQFIQVTRDTLNIVGGCYAYDAGHSAKYIKVE